jgi:hypothetical protein
MTIYLQLQTTYISYVQCYTVSHKLAPLINQLKSSMRSNAISEQFNAMRNRLALRCDLLLPNTPSSCRSTSPDFWNRWSTVFSVVDRADHRSDSKSPLKQDPCRSLNQLGSQSIVDCRAFKVLLRTDTVSLTRDDLPCLSPDTQTFYRRLFNHWKWFYRQLYALEK